MPNSLFTARLLGYLIGLLPLVALLLMFRQVIPQGLGLGLTAFGFLVSYWVQQRARTRFPYDFKNRAEWLALGVYVAVVVAMLLLVQAGGQGFICHSEPLLSS